MPGTWANSDPPGPDLRHGEKPTQTWIKVNALKVDIAKLTKEADAIHLRTIENTIATSDQADADSARLIEIAKETEEKIEAIRVLRKKAINEWLDAREREEIERRRTRHTRAIRRWFGPVMLVVYVGSIYAASLHHDWTWQSIVSTVCLGGLTVLWLWRSYKEFQAERERREIILRGEGGTQ